MNHAKYISILAMAAATGGMMLAADQPQRIKLATILPRGTSTHQALLEMAATWRAAGVNPTLYTDGVMGGEAETVRRMRIDQLQAAVLSVAGLSEIDHSVTALQLMPMVFRSLDEVAYVRDRMRPLLEKRLEEKGFVVLFWADAGWVQFFSKKPVMRPDDLRTQKIFALTSDSSESDLMKSAGFQAVPLEYTDILTGLQTGLIDAVPTAPFYALAGQFYLPAPYMLQLNYAPLVGGLVVNRKTWEAMPSATRDAMRRSAEEAGKKISLQGRREMQEAIVAMQKRGMKVNQLTPSAEAEWRELFGRLYPKIRGNLVPADVFDEVQRLLREYRK
ncbi:MAG: TRAP transporter substrate-binding protein DctP [Acidobacteriota bacterium]